MNVEQALKEAGRKARKDTGPAREVSRVVRMELRRKRLNVFADLIADGHTVTSAANVMGVGTATATGYMRDIRAGLETEG